MNEHRRGCVQCPAQGNDSISDPVQLDTLQNQHPVPLWAGFVQWSTQLHRGAVTQTSQRPVRASLLSPVCKETVFSPQRAPKAKVCYWNRGALGCSIMVERMNAGYARHVFLVPTFFSSKKLLFLWLVKGASPLEFTDTTCKTDSRSVLQQEIQPGTK